MQPDTRRGDVWGLTRTQTLGDSHAKSSSIHLSNHPCSPSIHSTVSHMLLILFFFPLFSMFFFSSNPFLLIFLLSPPCPSSSSSLTTPLTFAIFPSLSPSECLFSVFPFPNHNYLNVSVFSTDIFPVLIIFT